MSTFTGIANASPILMESFTDKAERDALLASDDTSITATAVVRAGGDLSPEIAIGNFETFSDTNHPGDDFIWEINGDNSFSLSYNGGTGNYDLGVSNVNNSDAVTTAPTEWFNQLAFSFVSGGVEINFTGDINGQTFSTFNSQAAGQWDGILFTFSEFSENNMDSFNITGTMSMDSALSSLGGDQFRGEFYLIQNTAVVPEPSSLALLLCAITTISFFWKRKTKLQ